MARDDASGRLGPCPLCGRPMLPGPSVDRHHWIPRTEGGRETAAMHTVCHRKIHAVLSEREIATAYRDAEALRGHPEIAGFLRWVARKPPDFVSPHRRPGRRR